MLKNFPNKQFKFILFLILIASTQIYSQNVRARYKILGIRVEGNKTADANTIIANSGLKVGSNIDIPGDATINAIKRLWALNLFTPDIKIEIEKKINNDVFLVIKLNEYPRLASYLIEGADAVDEDDIKKEVPFNKGHILKPQDIYRSIIKIKKLYDDEGYLNAKITTKEYIFLSADTTDSEIIVTWKNKEDYSDEITTNYEYNPEIPMRVVKKAKDRIVLVYKIDEGDEVTIKKISFIGNKKFSNDDLIDEMNELSVSKWWKFWSSADFKEADLKKDKESITNFYRKNGYRDFEILGDTLLYNKEKTEVELVISVYEGPQYIIRNIIWQGNSLFSSTVLSQQLGLQKGDIYDFEKLNQNLNFNQDQTDISSLYQDKGYLTSRIESEEKIVPSDSIDLIIKIQENNRFKIGKINIAGNDKTMGKVIRRELYTVPGDYYSRQAILRSIQQLANLKYFNVEKLYGQGGVTPQPMNDSTVAINYVVEEKSSDYLNASVGYSGGFGLSGSVGVTLTNFSIAHPFKLGGGQVLNFNWQFGVGNFYRTFTVGFTEPWFLDTPTSLGFEVFDTRQRYVYDLRQSGGTVRVGRRLTWPDNYFYIQGSFKYQYNDIIDGRNFYTEGTNNQFTLGTTLTRTDIDNPIFPSRGSKISLNVNVSGGPLLPGDVDYYKLGLKTEWYNRLFKSNKLTFYLGMDLGYLEELTDGTIIQPFEFFFMGGNGLIIATTPLRGYEDRSVGPRNSNGDIIGGRVMAKYTAEIRAALTMEPMPIYVLAFVEAGNTYLNISKTDLFNLRRSVGVGARLLINPIGLIGFDFGYGFDRKIVDGQDPSWVFHFQFGKGF